MWRLMPNFMRGWWSCRIWEHHWHAVLGGKIKMLSYRRGQASPCNYTPLPPNKMVRLHECCWCGKEDYLA